MSGHDGHVLPSSSYGGTSLGVDHVDAFPRAADRFATALARCDLHAPVPACSGWTTYDLLVHLGNTHAWAATIVETGERAAEQNDEPHSRRHRVVADWYVGKAGDLFEVLRSTPPDRPCWTFVSGAGVARFWSRRQLHETLMHLVDLDQAEHRTTDLSPVLAADGVDEVLTVLLRRMHERGHDAVLTAPLTIRATDVDRAWTLSPRPVPPAQHREPDAYQGPPLVVQRAHPQADRVEAPAAVLLQLLWGRAGMDHRSVVVRGDHSRVYAFLASPLTP